MSNGLALGIDLGTQRLKVGVADLESGETIAVHSEAVASETASDGKFEQDPSDWWESLNGCLAHLSRDESVDLSRIEGIGLSGHMHSVVLCGEDGLPVRPTVVWADTRSASHAKDIQRRHGDRLWNPAIAAYSAPKLLWIRAREPDVWEQASQILFPKDWLRAHLTEEFATDLSDASGSLLWDFERCEWDRELIGNLGLDGLAFPDAHESNAPAGVVSDRAAEATGLPAGVPVAFGSGDVAAALAGSGLLGKSALLVNAGTAAQVIRSAVDARKYARDSGERYLFETGSRGQRFAMGAVPSAGLALRWWAECLASNTRPEDLDGLAGSVDATGEPPVFLPYLQGTGTPFGHDGAHGAFLDLGAGTGRADLTRAVLEGVAYAIKLCADALPEDENNAGAKVVNHGELEVHLTGGLMKSPRMRALLSAAFPGRARVSDLPDVSLSGAILYGAEVAGRADFRIIPPTSPLGEVRPSAASVDPRQFEIGYIRFARRAHWFESKGEFSLAD